MHQEAVPGGWGQPHDRGLLNESGISSLYTTLSNALTAQRIRAALLDYAGGHLLSGLIHRALVRQPEPVTPVGKTAAALLHASS